MSLPSKTPVQDHPGEKRALGPGMFRKCDGCGQVRTSTELAASWEVCASCGHHHPMSVDRWRELLLDDGALDLWDEHLVSGDPLAFDDGKPYGDRLARARKTTGKADAVETGRGVMEGHPVAFGAYVFSFMGGSMGSVVGERVTRLFERALNERLPVVLLHASGGARMQEGILSLMQMAKTVAAIGRYRAAKLPYLSVLLHPTTGGVAASTALLGDVNVAEPGALIGFAGPRVIESTLRTTLPEGFQRAEFLVEHGMVDQIVPRADMKARLATLIAILRGSA